MSIVFANVVGFSVFLSAVVRYPRLRRLPNFARFALLEVALLSGSIAGTFLAITLYPLFVLADPTRVLALASVNSVLALEILGVSVSLSEHEAHWRTFLESQTTWTRRCAAYYQ